jgi:hypothetical protein
MRDEDEGVALAGKEAHVPKLAMDVPKRNRLPQAAVTQCKGPPVIVDH